MATTTKTNWTMMAGPLLVLLLLLFFSGYVHSQPECGKIRSDCELCLNTTGRGFNDEILNP